MQICLAGSDYIHFPDVSCLCINDCTTSFLYYYDSFIIIHIGYDGVNLSHSFFVAAVIKLIAYAADSFDFYSSHKLELIRLHRWRQHRQKVGETCQTDTV